MEEMGNLLAIDLIFHHYQHMPNIRMQYKVTPAVFPVSTNLISRECEKQDDGISIVNTDRGKM